MVTTTQAYKCPQCGSQQIQKLSVIYESGTSDISTTTNHAGIAIGKGFSIMPLFGRSRTSGTQQSQLAQKAAPPARFSLSRTIASTASIVVVGGIVAAIFLGTWAFWLLALLVCGYTAFAIKQGLTYNKNQWPKAYQDWERRWMCHRCGTCFTC